MNTRFSLIIATALFSIFGSLILHGCTRNDSNYWVAVSNGLNKVDKKQ